MKRLHITNGDSAAGGIAAAGVEGRVLPWRDMLHEGPVPAGLALEELSRVRARFLASAPWGEPYDRVLAAFAERDATLREYRRYDEIVLWFEHDLYDQLQLLQIVHWLALRPAPGARQSLLCIGAHPSVPLFRGLGQLEPVHLAGLFERRVPIDDGIRETCRAAWEAFTASDPTELQELADRDHSGLPYLRPALQRHLEQYPSTRDGLSRSAHQALQALESGPRTLAELFRVSQIESESAPFMGDTAFLFHLRDLAAGEQPLLRPSDGGELLGLISGPDPVATTPGRVELTEVGRKVLAGQADRSRFQAVDTWLGGVHLEGRTPAWRWNPHRRRLERQRR